MSTIIYVDLFFNILLTITQSIIFCLCLTPKFKIPICIIPNIICITFEFIIFVLCFNHMGLIWVKQLVVFLRFNTYAFVFFKDKIKYKLTVAIFNQILMIITDILSSSITLIIFGNKLFTDVFIKAIGSLLAFFFLVTLGILFIYLFRKFAKKETIQHFGTFIFFPISQIILITLCMYTAKKYIDYVRQDDLPVIFSNTLNSKTIIWWLLMLLGATLSVVADFIFYRVQKENSTNKKLKENLELADYRNELELQYYQQMQDNIEETRKIRHDFYNILSTMNDANKISGELKDEIETALRSSSTASVCENNIVNLIILNKNKICLENGIELDTDLNIPEEISVSKLDLLRVFSNILDNAIEANLKSSSKKRFINLSAKIRDNYLFISAKNPLNSEVIKHNKKYETTKKQKNLHGFGMIILDDIAKKYDGELIAENDKDNFTTLISMKIE